TGLIRRPASHSAGVRTRLSAHGGHAVSLGEDVVGRGRPGPGEVPMRQAVVPWAVLLALAGLAWAVTLEQARGMGIGPGTMGMALPLFLGLWVAMMAAMMFPSVAPVAILWTRSIARRSEGMERAMRMGTFVGGYLVA